MENNIQGSDEWLEDRKGKLTASNAQAISANGKGLETYVYTLLSEKYSSNNEKYTNEDMERGNELEAMARKLYELEKDVEIKEVGFIEMDEFSGASPDGLIGEDGLVEIKSPNDKNHFFIVSTEKIETKYIWQMQMQMLVTDRKWCDFVSFNPNFEKELVIIRVERDEKKIEKLKIGIEVGKELITKITKQYGKTT
jgi:putative phage-type endonuclease